MPADPKALTRSRVTGYQEATPEARFHASLVTNVFDLVDLLPRLNVSQDEELNRFAAEIKDRLCNFSAHGRKL
jgi:hypothetical protein